MLGDGEVAVLDVEDDDGHARLAREKKRDTKVTVTLSRLSMSHCPDWDVTLSQCPDLDVTCHAWVSVFGARGRT